MALRPTLALVLLAVLIVGSSQLVAEERFDRFGVALPTGAVARLGWQIPQDAKPPDWRKKTEEFGHGGGGFYQVLVSPDGKVVATRGSDTRVRLWRFSDGESLAVLNGHKRAIRAMDFSPDGRWLLSSAPREKVVVWDVDTFKEHATLPNAGNVVQFVDEGRSILLVEQDRISRIDPTTLEMTLGPEGPSYAVAFSPDGRLVASIPRYGDNTIRLTNIESGKELQSLGGSQAHPIALAFSPDGRTMAASGRDSVVRVWEVNTGEPLGAWSGHEAAVQSVAFSPDGRLVASGSWDGTVRIWKVAQGETLATLRGHIDRVTSVAFSPDSRHILSAATDGTALVWSLDAFLPPERTPNPLGPKDLVLLWEDLASDDSPRAYRAIERMTRHPEPTLEFVSHQLEPLLGPRGEIDLHQLVRQLNDDDFLVRERATELLLRLRNRAEELLQHHVAAADLSPEQLDRIQRILNEEPISDVEGPDLRRLMRVVHLLQTLGTDDAKDLLTWMAQDVPSDRVTDEAEVALEWLRQSTLR